MNNTLIVQAHGGLGNQLFQAQFAHFLAMKFPQKKVRLISVHQLDQRDFFLKSFFDNCPHVSSDVKFENVECFKNRLWDMLDRKGYRLRGLFIHRLEEHESMNLELKQDDFDLRGRVSIRGYFQNRKFLGDSCFTQQLKNFMYNSPEREKSHFHTVVHIRKGDFLKFWSHGPLANEYFLKILKNKSLDNSVLHTDATPRELEGIINLPFTKIKFSSDYSPVALLKDSINCSLFIGSNSTLSWWAAVAAKTIKKNQQIEVLMPKEWKREACTAESKLLLTEWQLNQPIWESKS